MFSCDKNEELWPVFNHCLEIYWPNHPNSYLLTETKKYKDIKTITKNYDIDKWTKRIRESLKEVKESKIIFICDDCFLNKMVNLTKLGDALNLLEYDNTASVNFEILHDPADIPAEVPGFKKKTARTLHKVSLLCGIWNKDKLLNVLEEKDCSPWKVEQDDNDMGYSFYVTENEKVLSWYRDGPGENAAIRQGKWMHGIEDFAQKEHLKIDFEKKGFWSIGYWEKYIELTWKINNLDREINSKIKEVKGYRKEIEELIENEKRNS